MYKFYMVSDATTFTSHSEIYGNMQLFWDPYAESDAYAIVDPHTKGELNKSGSLEFTVLPANIHYDDFHKRKTVVIVFDDNEWIYEGVVTDAPIDFFKQRKVTCLDPLSYFCDSIQFPDEKNQTTVATSGSADRYLVVDDTQLAGANPKSNKWYEQVIEKNTETGEETVSYTLSKDTSVLVDKVYYYKIKSSGKNYSGLNVPTKVPTKETVLAHLTRLVNVHNSQVDPFKQIQFGEEFGSKLYTDILKGDALTKEKNTKESFSSTNHRNTWDALKNDILDEYGRYFTISRNSSNELCLNYIELSQISDETTRLIEFTNNMLEMNEANNNDDDTFTVLLPIGKNNLTVANVKNHDSASSNKNEISPYITSLGGKKQFVVVSPKALSRYGVIIKTETFSDVSKGDDLYDRAVKYIKNNYDVHKEYEVKAIDLHFLDKSNKRIKIGDKCLLRSKWHEVDTENDDLYFVSVEHDLVNPENDSYTIGVPTADREAYNKTLTGQSSRTKSKASEAYGGATSGSSTFHSVLEDYIKPGIEWGLEIHSSLYNEVKKEGAFVSTRFEQDNEHIRLMAHKVFGDNKDSDYEVVPESMLAGSNPKNEGWYEKEKNVYSVTVDTAPVAGKTYYRLKLYDRISDIQVDGGGIHQRVNGNYERSISSASWIDENEDSIKALTGHIHYDPESDQIIIDSGSGLRTGHVGSVDGATRYVLVPNSVRNGNPKPNPKSKGWYEEKLNGTTGAWLGLNKADKATNEDYYTLTNDTSVKEDKNYYDTTTHTDVFTAEYGVYDEDTLTAGVVVQMINHPSFVHVSGSEKQVAIAQRKKPEELGWYEYDKTTGTYGISPDEVANQGSDYYKLLENESQTWTQLTGDKITIGPQYKTYKKVDTPYSSSINPKNEGWYEKKSGKYVLSEDTSMKSGKTYYTPEKDERKFIKIDTSKYPSSTNPSTETPIWYEKSVSGGYAHTLDESIVSGKTYYSTVNESTTQKIKKYIDDHDLTGTITEISSDIVAVDALFAKYIHADVIEAGTTWCSDKMWANEITAHQKLSADKITTKDIWLASNPERDPTESDSIKKSLLSVVVSNGVDENLTVIPSTSGDTVTLSFWTRDNQLHKVSFDKPASLGTATWSNGEESGIGNLTVKTEGGKKFFFAEFDVPTKIKAPVEGDTTSRISAFNYRRNGFSAIEGFENIPTIQYRPKVQYRFGKDEDNLGNTRDIGPLSTSIYVDVSSAYNDGVARTSYSSATWATDPETNDALLKVYSPSGMIFYADIDIPKKFHETDPDNRYTYAYYRDGLSAIDGFANTPTVRIRPSTNAKWAANEALLPETWVTGVAALSQNMYVDVSKVYNDGYDRASYRTALHTKNITTQDFILEVKAKDNSTAFYADYSTMSIYEGTDDNGDEIITYNRNGYLISNNSRLRNKPTLKTKLYFTGRWGANSDTIHEDEQSTSWNKDIFIDASDAYDDGYDSGYYDNSFKTITWSTDGTDKFTIKNNLNESYATIDLNIPTLFDGAACDYKAKGSSFSGSPSILANKPTIKTSMAITRGWYSGETHDDSEDEPTVWTKTLWIDATEPYVHGQAYGETVGEARGEANKAYKQANWNNDQILQVLAEDGSTLFYADVDIKNKYTQNQTAFAADGSTFNSDFSGKPTVRINMTMSGRWAGTYADLPSDSETGWPKSITNWNQYVYIDVTGAHRHGYDAALNTISTYSIIDDVTYGDGDQIDLDFNQSIVVATRYKVYDASGYQSNQGIRITAPSSAQAFSVKDDIRIDRAGPSETEPQNTSTITYNNATNTLASAIKSADGRWLYIKVCSKDDRTDANARWYKVDLR